jgi:arylsulfatase A
VNQKISAINWFLWIPVILLVFAGFKLYSSVDTHDELDKPPSAFNIVLLFADDLGYGDLSIYGHPTIRTPHLDSLARDGLRLMSFYNAAAACTPARAALLTGRYPKRVGLPGVIMPDSEHGLSGEEITLATALGDIGYQTKAIGKWHLGHASEEYMPTSHGFDSFFGIEYSNDMLRPWVQTDRPFRYYRDLEPVSGEIDQTRLTVNFTNEAVEFIEQADAGSPFFLYLPYAMPHVPVYAPEERQGLSLAGKYGDVIETIDWSVGEIVAALDHTGKSENTIVIFTSDNGPWDNMPDRMLSENVLPGHEVIKPWDAGTSGLLRGSKGQTYEGGFRVPAIMRWPGQIPANTVSSDIVTTMDLFPTLIKAAGGTLPDDRTIDGNDVIDHLRGLAPSSTETLYYFSGNNLHAVRHGEWKLMASDPDNPELYHLNKDPGEQFNRAGEKPDLVGELLEMMFEFEDSVNEW